MDNYDINDYESLKKEYEDFIHRMNLDNDADDKRQMISDMIDKMLDELTDSSGNKIVKDIFTTEEFEKTCSELGLVDDD
jgi:hypothetical protein